jgi:hypothetical protein
MFWMDIGLGVRGLIMFVIQALLIDIISAIKPGNLTQGQQFIPLLYFTL